MSDSFLGNNALRVERATTRVRVYMPGGIFEGDHHHPAGVRLSDSLRNAATGERYMLLTNVSIRNPDGSNPPPEEASAPLVLVNTQHASVIVPLGEAPQDEA